VELTVAVAILATVFAAIMPLFAGIRNSMDSRWAGLEMVQNARVLNEQLCRCLAKAKRIVTASSSTSDQGYVQFNAADGIAYRCALGASGYIEFGPLGALERLAGPVESLRFTCYDGEDLTYPMSDANDARLIAWEAVLPASHGSTAAKTVMGACYARVGAYRAPSSVTKLYDCATQGVLAAYCGESSTQVRSPGWYELQYGALGYYSYGPIRSDDGVRYTLSVQQDYNYAQMWFDFTIQEKKDSVTRVAALWNGRGINLNRYRTDGARLYIWNWVSSAYELVQASANTEVEVSLAGIRPENASRYIGGSINNKVRLLVVSNDRRSYGYSNQLLSDYIKVEISAGTGTGFVLP
jgi:hypothetical protein